MGNLWGGDVSKCRVSGMWVYVLFGVLVTGGIVVGWFRGKDDDVRMDAEEDGSFGRRERLARAARFLGASLSTF
ncbi:hypothetical protein OIU79_025515 [Salix purpurea]|uniref:Transmembrane protein n=1 Tax=Salix purpurea TaxID=77065 RepID=A0A9Q0W4S2_SALPP|nr:hypothetical protein OIU79_025515 [Salix purpurea]